MYKIIAIVGRSGSGKTTVCQFLEQKYPDLFNVVQSYTTRSPRYENEYGHTFDKTTEDFEYDSNQGTIISKAELYNRKYWATTQQLCQNRVNLYVIDYSGYLQIKCNPLLEVCPIYLTVPTAVIIDRLKERYSNQEELDYRISSDDEMFSFNKQDFHIVDGFQRSIEDIAKQFVKTVNRVWGKNKGGSSK